MGFTSQEEGSFWYYAPNKGAPIAFAILFLSSGLFHAYQCRWVVYSRLQLSCNRLTFIPISKYRGWRVTGLLPWSALLFVAGFVLRAIGAFGEWDNIGIFIASTVLLLVAPLVISSLLSFLLRQSRKPLTRTTIGLRTKLRTFLP